MSRLKELSNDKSVVLERILHSQGICKALYYSNRNFLDQPDLTDEEKRELVFDKLLPFPRNPKESDNALAYLTLSFKNYGLVNASFKSGYLYVNAFVHVDFIRTDYEFLRIDYMLGEIDKLLNQQRGIGIGKPEFYKLDELNTTDTYIGMYLAYKLYEFN